LQREADALVAKGCRAVKMRIGTGDPRETVSRVQAVREAIGPDVALMVDAYQQLTVQQAIRVGHMLEGLNLTWFEEPVICHDHSAEAEIRRALNIPLASGESLYGLRGIRDLLQADAVDVAMPDLQRIGGPTELLKAGRLCEEFDTLCSPHLFTEMSLSLTATLPSACYLEYMPWFERIYRERIELDGDGNAIVPERPGWGFSLDHDQIRRYTAV
jgi:L-alanine-DL-glutamate epimerase-like enolase superfamily enzyme